MMMCGNAMGEGRVDVECSIVVVCPLSRGGGVKIMRIKKRLAVVGGWVRWFEVGGGQTRSWSQTSGTNGVWWRTGATQVYWLVISDWGNPVSSSRKMLKPPKMDPSSYKNVVILLFPLPHFKIISLIVRRSQGKLSPCPRSCALFLLHQPIASAPCAPLPFGKGESKNSRPKSKLSSILLMDNYHIIFEHHTENPHRIHVTLLQ